MKYPGMYVGIVVQNNDPEKRGRVKVYIPHVNASVYEKWYGVKSDKSFKFVGRDLDSNLDDILIDLKNILPWSEQASPIGSQSASGRYNAYTGVGSVSDTNTLTNFAPSSGAGDSPSKLNTDGIGEKPSRKYEIESMRLSDAFADSEGESASGAKRPNKYSYNYRPNSYSNSAKGVFGIPNVGAHIWCFFRSGEVNDPVYFATALGEDDWKSIYANSNDGNVDYPDSYENRSSADSDIDDINIETYRNKFLINQKGGTLEFVNTDNREILKMTHYSGSFKEFNNHTSIELAAKNDQKLVLQDQYLTVNGYGGTFYGRDLDSIIQGDSFLRVGKQSTALHNAWREKAREMHHIKQLFEIQRADASAGKDVLPGAFVSPLQSKSGENTIPCPVCTSSSARADTYYDLNEALTSYEDPGTSNYGHLIPVSARTKSYRDVSKNNTSSQSGDQGINEAYQSTVPALASSGGTIKGDTCPSCGGTGKIQGSMDGSFPAEPKKQASTWLSEAKRIIGELADIEASLGMGGSEVINIAKHKTETIGMVMNDFGSVRIDTQGKYYKDGVRVLSKSVVNTRSPSPVIEYVHVDDLPGGSYTLNVCNRWNVQVGGGGVSMKSYGPIDIGGTIVNLGGTQVNIGSENEVNIDGGKRLNIVSDILTLRQRTGKQVLVDSNLGVSKNVVIGGGLHVEGELCVNHITAPVEIQETQDTELWGTSEWDKTKVIGYSWNGIPHDQPGTWSQEIYSRVPKTDLSPGRVADDDCTRIYPHSHHFKNVPLHLKKKNEDVRNAASDFHDGDRKAPEHREWVPGDSKDA